MSQTFDTSIEPDKAVLVSVGESLDELESLCETCNICTVGRVTQNVKEPDVTYYIGSGKVDEVCDAVRQQSATVVVFDVELSGSKVRNLEGRLGVPVLDRSKIILDIFAARAQSAEGQLQVELAQLKYNLPRLAGNSGLLSKMRNGVGMRGPGEKKLELDRRKIRDEILMLEKKLEKLKTTRDLSRKQSMKSGKSSVCLVGYTNSGKSTLLNAIAKSGVLAEDKLFATLDPKTSNVFLGDGVQILLTDTVGFIDRLPHEFIRAFESTLDSVRYADLLLHVVDISNPEYQRQMEVVGTVLAEIHAENVPVITVYNKADKISFAGKQDKNSVTISAKNNVNIDLLKRQIIHIIQNENSSLRRSE